MNVLLLGSGGREHALAWKLSQSKKLAKLYIAPGNAGTNSLGVNVDIGVNDFDALGEFALKNKIDLIVVGPEDPLVNGIHKYFTTSNTLKHIDIFGPSTAGALLEGSKEYAKEFMARHNIPTAKYFTVHQKNLVEGIAFLKTMTSPYVLKADGLAAGKGVLIIDDLKEAETELAEMLQGKFGKASEKVVIEEHLSGIELSTFVITDGKNYVTLPEAKDYKRIGEGDTGLNTGGMGCVSPVPFAGEDFMKKVEERVIAPTVAGLKKDNIEFVGFIFFGLMNNNGEPWVIEYNVRMGDPETEVLMPRLKGDLLEVLKAAVDKNLEGVSMEIDPKACTTVMLVSGGYPGSYEKGMEMSGLEDISESLLFHAGTKTENGKVLTNGGRVIAISSIADTFEKALEKSYRNAKIVNFEGKYYRHDIGFDL